MNIRKEPPEVFYNKVLLKISQNSQGNSYAGVSFLVKLQASFLSKNDIPWLSINHKIRNEIQLLS